MLPEKLPEQPHATIGLPPNVTESMQFDLATLNR